MKIKQKSKSLLILLILAPVFTIMLTSSRSGKGGSGKKGGPTPDIQCTVVEKQTTLVLYDNFPLPANRQTNYAFPQPPNLWAGNASATGLYDNPNTKYYCLITVATDCRNYGENGTKFYRWNSQTGDNLMKINVPSNMMFRISIEYYEKCGPYWIGSNPYGRGKWYSEKTVGFSPVLSFNQWLFLIKENC